MTEIGNHPLSGKAILVVDDEPSITELLVELLQGEGYEVETAANGAIALDKLQECGYDVILCDLKMPVLDGPGLYRDVARHHPGLERRFIFVTGSALDENTQKFLKQTGRPWLSKPFRWGELRRLVHQAAPRV